MPPKSMGGLIPGRRYEQPLILVDGVGVRHAGDVVRRDALGPVLLEMEQKLLGQQLDML